MERGIYAALTPNARRILDRWRLSAFAVGSGINAALLLPVALLVLPYLPDMNSGANYAQIGRFCLNVRRNSILL